MLRDAYTLLKALMKVALLLRWIMSAVLIKLSRHGRRAKNSKARPRGRKAVFHPMAAAINTEDLMAISQHVQAGKHYLRSTRFT